MRQGEARSNGATGGLKEQMNRVHMELAPIISGFLFKWFTDKTMFFNGKICGKVFGGFCENEDWKQVNTL